MRKNNRLAPLYVDNGNAPKERGADWKHDDYVECYSMELVLLRWYHLYSRFANRRNGPQAKVSRIIIDFALTTKYRIGGYD